MKIYVAAAYELREAALALMRRLENERHEITWKWPVHETDEVSPRQMMAEKDFEGVVSADLIISCPGGPGTGFETGLAVGLGKHVIFYRGKEFFEHEGKENIFIDLETSVVAISWDELLRMLETPDTLSRPCRTDRS